MLHRKIREKMESHLPPMGNQELSQKADIPIGTLNKILNGDTESPSFKKVAAIAQALGCSIDELSDSSTDEILNIDNMTDEEVEAAIQKEGMELVDIINQLPESKRAKFVEAIAQLVQVLLSRE